MEHSFRPASYFPNIQTIQRSLGSLHLEAHFPEPTDHTELCLWSQGPGSENSIIVVDHKFELMIEVAVHNSLVSYFTFFATLIRRLSSWGVAPAKNPGPWTAQSTLTYATALAPKFTRFSSTHSVDPTWRTRHNVRFHLVHTTNIK